MNAPKFIQIATGQWKGANGDYNHTVYGLTAEGVVYKFFVNEGWTLLRGRNEPAQQRNAPARRGQGVRATTDDFIDDDVPF